MQITFQFWWFGNKYKTYLDKKSLNFVFLYYLKKLFDKYINLYFKRIKNNKIIKHLNYTKL